MVRRPVASAQKGDRIMKPKNPPPEAAAKATVPIDTRLKEEALASKSHTAYDNIKANPAYDNTPAIKQPAEDFLGATVKIEVVQTAFAKALSDAEACRVAQVKNRAAWLRKK